MVAPSAAPKVLGFKALAVRAFAGQILGGKDCLSELLQGTQLPQSHVHEFMHRELDYNGEVDESTFMTAFAVTAQACGLSLDRLAFQYGEFWLPWACECAGYLEECIFRVADNFGDFAQQLNQVVGHIYSVVCTNRPWLPETLVTRTTPSGPLVLGMLVQDPSKAGYAALVLSMYSGMLRWAATQVFQVDVHFSALETTVPPGGGVFQSCRIEYLEDVVCGPASGMSTARTALHTSSPAWCPEACGLDPVSFQHLLPFHFILDQELRVLQAGEVLKTMVPAMAKAGTPVAEVLKMRVPMLGWDAHGVSLALGNPKGKVVLSALSSSVELRGALHRVRLTRRTSSNELTEGGEAIVFLGSPCLANVEEMKSLGLCMSHYASHDPTADELLVSTARHARAAEALQAAHHSNRALTQTLKHALVTQGEASPKLHVDSAGHLLLDLLDRLLLGQDVNAQAVLAARSALLKCTTNLWKPLEVDWSGVAGGDKEVNQALARMLGSTGYGDQDEASQWQARSEVAASEPLPNVDSPTADVSGGRRSLDSQAASAHASQSHAQAAAAAGATSSMPDSQAWLAAYRRAGASRIQLTPMADDSPEFLLNSGSSAGFTGLVTPPNLAPLRCGRERTAAGIERGTPLPADAVSPKLTALASPRPALNLESEQATRSSDTSSRPSRPSAHRHTWLENMLSVFKAGKAHNAKGRGREGQADSAQHSSSQTRTTGSNGSSGPEQQQVPGKELLLGRGTSSHMGTYTLLAPPSDKVAAALQGVDEWQWDAFALNEVSAGRPLSFLAFHLISRAGLVQRLRLNAVKLSRFLMHIEDGYGDNPYHNRVHACDVLRSLHVMLFRGGVLDVITKHTSAAAQATGVQSLEAGEEDERATEAARLQQLLRCYLAAIVHDYEHRGVNNDFLIRSSDPLALLYNDMSPLESHHVAAAFTLMHHRDYAFLPTGNEQARARLRKDVIELVLATDMKQHFALTSSLTQKMKSARRYESAACGAGPTRKTGAGAAAARLSCAGHSDDMRFSSGCHMSSSSELQAWDHDTEMLMLKMVLKAADLGHLTGSTDVHKNWVAKLEEELFLQGDRERALGQPISPLMDRNKSGIQKSQTGFFSVVAQPMYTALAQVFPECHPLVSNLSCNFEYWRKLEQGPA